MKNLIIGFAIPVLSCFFVQHSLAQNCGYMMNRKHANYFASAVGYNGYGLLPVLDVADMKKMLVGDWHDYYENDVPTCSYCQKNSVLQSYGNCVALCNAFNYYVNLMTAEHNSSMRMMDLEIERLRTQRNRK